MISRNFSFSFVATSIMIVIVTTISISLRLVRWNIHPMTRKIAWFHSCKQTTQEPEELKKKRSLWGKKRSSITHNIYISTASVGPNNKRIINLTSTFCQLSHTHTHTNYKTERRRKKLIVKKGTHSRYTSRRPNQLHKILAKHFRIRILHHRYTFHCRLRRPILWRQKNREVKINRLFASCRDDRLKEVTNFM